jgi:hypothetical protein
VRAAGQHIISTTFGADVSVEKKSQFSQSTSMVESSIFDDISIRLKKVVGKNAPIRKELNRPKNVPSIPSNSNQPPEDKTMVTIEDETNATDQMQPSYRKSDYLTEVYKSNNPVVGPGSYDPRILKSNVGNVDWSRAPDRFRQKKDSRN